MNTVEYAQRPRSARSSNVFLLIVYLILGASLVSIAVLLLSIEQGKPLHTAPPVRAGIPVSIIPLESPRFDAKAVFGERVKPVLDQLQLHDTEAARRALARIYAHFDRAKIDAPEFAESIIGPLDAVKTTYLAGRGLFSRWAHSDPTIQPVADHVRWNYEQHVTSGPKIKEIIVASIAQLEQEFRANRNEALQTIGSNLRAANLPVAVPIDEKKLDEFCQNQFDTALWMIDADHVAEKAALRSGAAFTLSTAATLIAERAIIYMLSDAATAAGGSVAVATAGGAGAGSWVPGAGTAIGATTGLLVGIAVDMWISHRNKQRTIDQVCTSLSQIEEGILHGDRKHPGIQNVYDDAASRQTRQLGDKLQAQLTEAAQ